MKKLTTEEFIAKAKLIHGDQYDYSLVIYNNRHIKVKIICPIHGIFEQTPGNHLYGKECLKCSYEKHKNKRGLLIKNSNKRKKRMSEKFYECATNIHKNRYDYSKVNYIDLLTEVIIICPLHGEFRQLPSKHIYRKNGCPKCRNQKNSERLRVNSGDALKKCIEIHKNKYTYVDFNIKSVRDKIKIICPLHGEFIQTAWHHMKGHCCPNCKTSHGENKIKKFLEDRKINYIPQKTFDDCVGKRNKLPFDFYLPDYNLVIEYQGRQHYEVIEYRGGITALEKIQVTDKLKKDYCSLKGIKLLEITYKDDVEKVLNQFLCENSPNSLQ
jgi:hypothetical protein